MKFKMPKKSLFSFVMLLGVAISTSAIADDKCSCFATSSKTRSWNFTSNGYSVSGEVWGWKSPDGTYTFQGFLNDYGATTNDSVNGTCKDRHIAFTRKRWGSWTQKYDGWFWELGADYKMAGTFAHNDVDKYSWCGYIGPVIPH
jgi:hypothetical protein